jgi:hypothetical protein
MFPIRTRVRRQWKVFAKTSWSRYAAFDFFA